MECTKDKLYFLVESSRRTGMNATEIHRFMNEAWPNECLSVAHIRRLCQEFREGTRNSFVRCAGQGRKMSDKRLQSIEDVDRLLGADPTITIQNIANTLDLSHTMVQRIVSDDLERIWFKTKWVPHTLSDHNKAIRVERCQNLIESFQSRLCKSNLITIDEKFFYCRKMKSTNKIGSWLSAAGDQQLVQTAITSRY